MLRRRGSVLLAACVFAQVATAAWDDEARVALTVGDEIAGFGRLGLYGINYPVALDDRGGVVFRGTTSEGREGFYRGDANGLTTLWSSERRWDGAPPQLAVSHGGRAWLTLFPQVYELRDGGMDPVADLTALLPAGERFCGGEFRVLLNDAGDLAFLLISAPARTGCDSSDMPYVNERAGIYLRPAGASAAQLVAQRPGDSSSPFDTLDLFALADDGTVLYHAAAASPSESGGLFAWRGGLTQSLLTAETLRADGTPLGAFTAVAANGSGDVAVIASDDGALYRAAAGAPQRLIGPGDLGPTLSPISRITHASLNPAGDVAVTVQWDGPPNPPWNAELDGVMLIGDDGVPVTVASAATVGLLNARGEVAYFLIGGPQFTPLVEQDGAYAIELWRDGVVRRVVADGDRAPDGGAFASQWLIANALRLTEDGRVLLTSFAAERRQAVLCGDAAGFHAVVRQGDPAPGGGVFTDFGPLFEVDGAFVFAAASAPAAHVYGGPIALYRATPTRIERLLGEGDVAAGGAVIQRLVDGDDGFHEASRVTYAAAPDGTVLIHADSSAGRRWFRLRPGGAIEIARVGAASMAALAGDGSVIAALRRGDPSPYPGRYEALARWDDGPAPTVLLAYDDPVFGAPSRHFTGLAVRDRRVFFQRSGVDGAWYSYLLTDASLAVIPPPDLQPQRRCWSPAFLPSGRLLCTTAHDDGGGGEPFPLLLADATSATVIPPLRNPNEWVGAINDRGDALLISARTEGDVLRERLRRAGADAALPCPLPPTAVPEPFPTQPTPTPQPGPSCTDDACVRLSVSVGSGRHGELVTLEMRLADSPWPVAGVQNNLEIDPAVAAIAAAVDGRPACRVNAAIDKHGTAFSFQSNGAVRALVLALDNLDPIPDGSLLYSCDVRLAADAQPGRYRVRVLDAAASDPNGQALPAEGTGEIEVLAETTAPVDPTGGAGGGCQIAAREGATGALWCAVAGLLLLAAGRVARARVVAGGRSATD
ncbi:MAG: hypothetical protein SF182_06375 [Deltaproteobacteria bacterium]|nr:hypothetical protein [Deltaproteobacteria bacterium]